MIPSVMFVWFICSHAVSLALSYHSHIFTPQGRGHPVEGYPIHSETLIFLGTDWRWSDAGVPRGGTASEGLVSEGMAGACLVDRGVHVLAELIQTLSRRPLTG